MTTNTGSRFEDRLLAAILELHPEITREPSTRPARRLATRGPGLHLPGQPGRRFALAAAAVVVAGAVGLGAVLPSAGRSGQAPEHGAVLNARTVGYRVTEALNQATGNSIEYLRDVKTNGAGDVVSTTEVWFYDGSHRVESFGNNGSPETDESVTTAAGLRAGLVVNYSGHTWFRTSQRAITLPRDGDVATVIRGELQSRQLTEVGRAVVDGQQTIELAGDQPQSGLVRLWIDPGTYLPVQREVMLPGLTSTQRIRWLPPSAANLALLNAPVPPGFTLQAAPPSQGVG